MKYNFASKQML